jgi:hypothetical protein
MARKRKRNPTLIALLVLIPLLAWGAFELRDQQRFGAPVEPGQEPRLGQFLGMGVDEVTRVELKSGGSTVSLSKSGKEWRLEQPVAAKADAATVEQMVKDLLEPNLEAIVTTEMKNAKEYGLDKPELTVTLASASGDRRVIQTGSKDPRGQSVYGREASRPVLFLLSSFTVDNLKGKKPGDLRDKTVLAVDPEKVTGITIRKPAGTVALQRKGKDAWALTQPAAAPAENSEVSFLLTQIKDLKVETFIEEKASDLAKYGLAQPQVNVTLAGTPEMGLLLGKPVPGEQNVYAARAGEQQVFSVRKSALTDFGKAAGDLRDKTLLSFKRDDATRIALSSPAGQIELQRDGKEWKVTKPFAAKAKMEKLDSVLFTLESIKGTSVAAENPSDLAPYGLAQPQVKVQVWLKGQTAPREVVIGKKATNGYYARSGADPAVFVIPEYTLTDLQVKPADLKEPSPAAGNSPAPPGR